MDNLPDSNLNSSQNSAIGLLARIYWFFIGNIFLFMLSLKIAMGEINDAFVGNLLFGITVVTLIFVRFIDIKFLNGQTAESEPATMTDWRRYTLKLIMISIAILVLANLSNHFKLLSGI